MLPEQPREGMAEVSVHRPHLLPMVRQPWGVCSHWPPESQWDRLQLPSRPWAASLPVPPPTPLPPHHCLSLTTLSQGLILGAPRQRHRHCQNTREAQPEAEVGQPGGVWDEVDPRRWLNGAVLDCSVEFMMSILTAKLICITVIRYLLKARRGAGCFTCTCH